ncbi:MAG: carboxymuconolactone decarboxylase family protein [Chloroflexi bacterium]|nr:carboxymuconolactone decarboxylase family protein [Chloroflexota bacterium]
MSTEETEALLKEAREKRGYSLEMHRILAENDPVWTKKYGEFIDATYTGQRLLDRKTKELLIIVACVASGDMVSHIQIHMHAAHKAGATPEEIMEALNLVGGWIGIRKVVGLEAWRATFRPDIPTIDRVVELR